MEPGGRSSGAKSMEVRPEEMGLHDSDTDSSQLNVSTQAIPHFLISSLPMVKGLSMKKRRERGKKQESSKEKQEKRRKSDND